MDSINEIETNMIKKEVLAFLEKYGFEGLHQAMEWYMDMHQVYICKTRTSTSKIYIRDINYITIQKHLVTIHTIQGSYDKYGTLNNELAALAKYGFIRCSQNCIVPLTKIRTVTYNDVVLLDGTKISLSKRYASKVMIEFRFYK